MSRLPSTPGAPIVVTPHRRLRADGPVRDAVAGEFRIRLHAREGRELALTPTSSPTSQSRCPTTTPGRQLSSRRDNQWFEGNPLRRLAVPPLRHFAQRWKRSHLARMAASDWLRRFHLLVSEGYRRLPPDAPLAAAWLQAHERNKLRHNPQSALVQLKLCAGQLLLPLERNPETGRPRPYEPDP